MTEGAALPIPATPGDITPSWLDEALGEHTHGATVTDLAVQDIGEGTGIFGQIARLGVTYDQAGEAPSTLIVKMPCTEPANLEVALALGIYEREINFFQSIAPSTPIRVPECYRGQLADDGRFVLLLEDLSDDYDVGDQVVGATVDQAQQTIAALAELHTAWWEQDELGRLSWLPVQNAPAYVGTVPGIYSNGLPVLESEWADRVPDGLLDIARRLEPRFEELLHRLAAGPTTFAHADTRLDNIFFAHDGSGVAFIDFQLSLRAKGVTDLAYLIGTSVRQDEAREHWEALLRGWHEQIADLGVTDYSWDDCVYDYRECVLFYLVGAMSLIASFDTGNERGDAMADAYTSRICHHIIDTGAATVLS